MYGALRVLGILMVPISVLIILQALQVFSLQLPFNLLLLGALFMILMQVLNIVNQLFHNKHVSLFGLIIVSIMVLPAVAYLLRTILPAVITLSVPLILGVLMLTEALYAIH